MKKGKSLSSKILVLFVVTILPFRSAQASMFGEETVVLVQILANAVKQLYELQKIIQTGEDTLNLLRDINHGINDSMEALNTIGPYMDPGVFAELKKVKDVAEHFKSVYGIVTDSPDKDIQKDTDNVVAEAIGLNNALYDYAKELDGVGEKIKNFSHEVSPGGAAKLTAQSLGVLVHVMNQQLRAQATGLKLHAQGLAIQNKREKETTAEYLREAHVLQSAMKSKNVNFAFPSF
ncbi:MAG: hypothetical protein V4736_10690 [Bdellovibrionota bacterium]